jgi:hypothetical protein
MNLLDMVTGGILEALGTDMNTFVRLFPAARTMCTIFIALGLGILLLNFVWQLFKNFGLGLGIEAEDPVKLAMRTIFFMLLVIYAGRITDIALSIGGTPYSWILDASLPPLQFASFLSAITPIIGMIANGSVLLIAVVFIIVLAWNYLKLLLEAAERYILVGVLVYTAPVAFALGGSQTTSSIFKNWCRMLGGQIFLLLMNAWCLKLFTTMVGTFIADPLGINTGGLFVWMLCAIAFLKISHKIDSFMSALGINVGNTGGSMIGDAIVAARALSGVKRVVMAGFGGGKGGGAVSGGSGGAAASPGVFSGGLSGMVGRRVSDDMAGNLTSQPGAEKGGVYAGIGSKLYNSSVGEPGGFASEVIGSVAKGRASDSGVITGDKAVDAFGAYMGADGNGIPGSPASAIAADEAYDVTGGGMQAIPAPVEGSEMAGNLPADGDAIPISADGGDISADLPADVDSIPMGAGEDYAGVGFDPVAMEGEGIPATLMDESGSVYGDNGASAMDAAMADSYAQIPTGLDESGAAGVSVDTVSADGGAIPSSMDGGAILAGASPDSGADANVVSGADSVSSGGMFAGAGSAIPMQKGSSSYGQDVQTDGYAEQVQSTAFAENFAAAQSGNIPTSFKDITMGGGRITGTEISTQNPKGAEFAMYHTGQYTKPEGPYSVVQSLDGAKWCRQYAAPAVERTPVSEKDGKVTCNEKIVKKLPKSPPRIDRV